MFGNLSSLFHNQLIVQYTEFKKYRNSGPVGNGQFLLSAIELATSLFHFREHIPEADRKSRGDVENECLAYKFVADVSNAAKHGQVTRKTPNGVPTLVSSVTDIRELILMTEFKDRNGIYCVFEAIINVICSDGQQRWLDDALLSTLNYWGNELERLGIRTHSEVNGSAYPGTYLVTRENAEEKSFNTKIHSGLEAKFEYRYLRFDYELGKGVPVDLTGCKMTFTLREAAQTIQMQIVLPDKKGNFLIEVALNENQSRRLMEAELDKNLEAFLREISIEEERQINQKLHEAMKACLEKPES